MHNVIYKGEDTPLFFKYYKDVNEDDLKLYIYKNDEYVEIDASFKKIDKYFYRCIINLDEDIGAYYFQVKHKDDRIGGGVLQIKENILDKLYNNIFGNWEIKDKQMIFYDLKGNELVRYKLFDKAGNPTEVAVVKRVKQ